MLSRKMKTLNNGGVIVHLTTVHPRGDTRIRFREVASIAEREQCILIVADGLGDAQADGFLIHDLGRAAGGRVGRACLGMVRAFRRIRRLRPAAVHFHDPELLLLALLLRLFGYRVVYDVHEDVPRQILAKYWLPAALRKPVAWIIESLEWLGGRLFNAIVAATPKIAARFPAHKTVVVQNFPILSELMGAESVPYAQRPPHFVYVGNITAIRGAREMVQALAEVPPQHGVRLRLAGTFAPAALQQQIQALPCGNRVDCLGWADRKNVGELLGKARGGLVVLHPTENYTDSYPLKMFEYMIAGLPVIASDFPLWREIIGDSDCALLVDPLNPLAIGGAMNWILEHPREAEAMGERGRQVVISHFNWETEKRKLLDLYAELLA
jgi:glycosyltransferase involved in cell wall biosynthesis